MSNSTSKGEVMKPIFIKAGIPLAISIAGFIYATFIATTSNTSSSENRENSTENNSREEGENLVDRYERVVERVRDLRSDKRLLEEKVKTLLRKTRDRSCVIREKSSRLKVREEQVLRCLEEQETWSNVVKKLEMEVEKLQSMVDQLEEEKYELSNKLELAEKSVRMNFKIEEESTDEYKQIVEEYESVQKDRALEIKELIYLRWSNACLRHELMRTRVQEEHKDKNISSEHDYDEYEHKDKNISSEHDYDEYGDFEGDGIKPMTGKKHVCSKRRKLVEKFKRWVESSEKKTKRFEKEKHEIKCFGRHSDYSYRVEDEDHGVLPRNSFSSA